MVHIENAAVKAYISEHGAELKKLESKESGRNYIYDGSAGWKRSAPVLFPNIGGLAEEKLLYNGNTFPALPHGFARDMDFEIENESDDRAVFCLRDSEETRKYYPFSFILRVTYTLLENGIEVRWDVENKDRQMIFFSIGAHPGFCLTESSTLKDYELIFNKKTSVYTRRVIGRYLTKDKEHISDPCRELPLSSDLMANDAIILEDTGISQMNLYSEKYNYNLSMEFPDFPVVALWTDTHQVENAKFFCIEPWCGINSLIDDHAEDISKKDRINKLDPNQVFSKKYSIRIEE